LKKDIQFLKFEDWFPKNEHLSKDWLIVGRIEKEKDSDLFTYSALAKFGNGIKEKLLKDPNWDIRLEFGNPYFYSIGGEKFARYDKGNHLSLEDIDFYPFLIYREYHGYIKSYFEMIQEFILYHELFFNKEKNEYQRIDDDGEIITVVKIIDNKHYYVIIDVHHLRDFLAANKYCLVRYHDFDRRSKEDMSSIIKDEIQVENIKNDLYCFELTLRIDLPLFDFKSCSRLLGKDIVQPYDQPDDRHTWFVDGKRKKQFSNFIIDCKKGTPIEFTCDDELLSNYFIDKGSPHFLTPIFFTKKVFDKYFRETSKYRVGEFSIRCLDLWNIQYDITEEDLVQVWLGDLGHIPYTEQLHWRQYNVCPKGTITKHRFLKDIVGEWIESPKETVFYLKTALEEIQKYSKEKFGEELFNKLHQKDIHHYEGLHLPLTDEWKEFDEQVLSISKIVIDSLNVNLLSKITKKKIDGKEIKGSIDLLYFLLTTKEVDEDIKDEIILPFHAIQTIRSTGVAHDKGENFEKALKKYGLNNISNSKKIKKLIEDLTKSVLSITKIINDK